MYAIDIHAPVLSGVSREGCALEGLELHKLLGSHYRHGGHPLRHDAWEAAPQGSLARHPSRQRESKRRMCTSLSLARMFCGIHLGLKAHVSRNFTCLSVSFASHQLWTAQRGRA